MVFFLSLFATNMTAFAILGSSGQAYRQGIGIYGLMASSSCFVIPLTIFFIGTRLWAVGKKFGHQTQVSFFRDRWECNHIGTVIFALSAAMLVPYMIISIMGGGTVLAGFPSATHQTVIAYWLGCAIVALVVTVNVFFGGMRGTVWVNIFQTYSLPLLWRGGGGGHQPRPSRRVRRLHRKIGRRAQDALSGHARKNAAAGLLELHAHSALLHHVSAHGHHVFFGPPRDAPLNGRSSLYPMAIMAIWLPCVFLGVIGAGRARAKSRIPTACCSACLTNYAPAWLAGLLGAGIISAVMGSDAHQVLAPAPCSPRTFSPITAARKFGETARPSLPAVSFWS